MGRLIDADRLKEVFSRNVVGGNAYFDLIDNAPTVEAIPKAEVKMFLEEGTKNVSNDVLAIVREDYIHKADYENRLKADMVAMFKEIQLEIEELEPMYMDMISPSQVDEVIEQKIDKLKGA